LHVEIAAVVAGHLPPFHGQLSEQRLVLFPLKFSEFLPVPEQEFDP